MATFKSFEELEVWKLSRDLCLKIWLISNQGSFYKDFSLKTQINRASGSIMDNIAEGFGRGGNKEFVHFLSIARGSNDEVRSQLYRALDRKHISDLDFTELSQLSKKITSKTSNLITHLNKSNLKSSKFKSS